MSGSRPTTVEQMAARDLSHALHDIAAGLRRAADHVARTADLPTPAGHTYSGVAAQVIQELMGVLPNLGFTAVIRHAATADAARAETNERGYQSHD